VVKDAVSKERMVHIVIYGESLLVLDPLSSNLFPIFMFLHKREPLLNIAIIRDICKYMLEHVYEGVV
jgi:hypothetical protein